MNGYGWSLASLGLFPSPPVGEGGSIAPARLRRVRGLSRQSHVRRVERTPHPALRATFSHKGRRKKGAADCVQRLMLGSAQYAHDVALLHDQEFFAIELDFGARPLTEKH